MKTGFLYNKYFVDHPEQVLGSMEEIISEDLGVQHSLPAKRKNTDLKEPTDKSKRGNR